MKRRKIRIENRIARKKAPIRRDGLFNCLDTKAKIRQLKHRPVKGLCGRCLSEFIDWRKINLC
jgi:hypothetical protein